MAQFTMKMHVESASSGCTGLGIHIQYITMALAARRLARLPAAVISGARQELPQEPLEAPGRGLHPPVAHRLGILIVQPHFAMQAGGAPGARGIRGSCRSRAPDLDQA